MANRIQILKALLRFGGSKDVPAEAEAVLMPNTSMERGIGYRFSSPDEENDQEETDSNEEDDSTTGGYYNPKRAKLLKSTKKKIK